jgi:glycosyltransferase involved in cell wall biosynthesis
VKVPSTVDVRKYKKHVFLNKKTFTIGWIGTPVTQPMLELLRAPLLRLSKELSFKMVVVGGYWHVTGLNIECVPWSEVTESQVVAEFDVGVMPLRDLEWERCKCGYKLIQYMAAGVVPVGANVGENRAIIRDGETGFLCETEGDWYNTLALLASNPSRCAAIAAAARLAAETKFDLGVAVKLVHQAFKRALEYEADL